MTVTLATRWQRDLCPAEVVADRVRPPQGWQWSQPAGSRTLNRCPSCVEAGNTGTVARERDWRSLGRTTLCR